MFNTISRFSVMWEPQVIFCCIFVTTVISQNLTCHNIYGVVNNVKWPSTNASILSQPPCVDENMELLYRGCVNGVWEREPKCFYIQAESIPRCPEGYIEVGNICYTYLDSTFPPKCPSANLLPFQTYKMSVNQEKPFWMPITRDLSNGLGPMQWVEFSILFKTTYNSSDYLMSEIGSDKNCILYNRGFITAVSCNETHRAMCAYSMEQWTEDSVCTKMDYCTQIDFFDSSKCVCMKNSSESFQKKAEFVSLVQNNIYSVVSMGDPCSFGLEKSNNTYMWSNSKQKINYTWWSPDAVFHDEHKYGAVSNDGWILTQQPLNCSLYEVEIEEIEPNLFLNFTDVPGQWDLFELKITNVNLVKIISTENRAFCFTNADPEELIIRFDSLIVADQSDNTLYLQFLPNVRGPGHYWCEAFKLLDSTVIKSNVIFHKPDYKHYEFVTTWKISYHEKNSDPVGEATTTILEKIMSNVCPPDIKYLYTPRIMKMYDLNTIEKTLLVKIHITSTNVKTNEEEDADYLTTNVIKAVESAEDASFLDFLSAENCFEETDGVLTWPKTPLGLETTSTEFCFTENATRVSRACLGDFISGAQWTSYEHCERLDYSPMTNQLVDLLVKNKLDDEISVAVYEISKNYTVLNALDVYLISEMFNSANSGFSLHVAENFGKIVDNLLNIRDVVIDSQAKTKAIVSFLKFITIPTASDLKIDTRNFVFYSLKKQDMVGVSVVGSEARIETSYEIENFDSAIMLSSEDGPLIPKNARITLSIFFRDYFFDHSHKVITPIFSLFLHSEFNYTVVVKYNIKPNVISKMTCFRWNFIANNNFGSWEIYPEENKTQKENSLLTCRFPSDGFYGISFTPVNENVTDELIDVLVSNDTAAVKIDQLSDISEKYEKFKPIDVSFASKILQEVKSDDEISVQSLAKFVSNSHKIKQEFLLESQLVDKATDRILQNVDLILQNHKQQIVYITEHFAVLKVDLETVNFTGAVLYQEKTKIHIRVLQGNESIDYSQNFDSAVLLSAKLKQQLASQGTIVLSIYSNDALFNEKDPHGTTKNAIFGVILPEIGDYQGPVSIIQRVEENNFEDQCVYWHYSNATSYWKKDSMNKTSSNFVQCDYWHTTHFALLLLPRSYFNHYYKLLDVITTINNILSFVCLCCIVLTAILFKQWRRNIGNQILLNFVFVLLFHTVVFYISGSISHFCSFLFCTTIGVLLHYFTISEFCWMLVIAVLQYRRFVNVLGAPPRNVLLKGCLCGWGMPLIPVTAVLVFDRNSYILDSSDLCYPSGLSLYLAVWLPVAVIIAINCVIFLIILYNIGCKKSDCVSKDKEAMYQLRLAVFLFFMFGLTWVFGMLSSLQGGIFFLYLFTITATWQGVVLFLFFIAFNESTRSLYVRAFKRINFNFIVNYKF